MTTTHIRTWRPTMRTLAGWFAAAVITAPVVACNDIHNALNVTAPDKIDATTLLHDPQNADLLVQSTRGDFECAWGAFVVDGAMMGGELADASITAARFSLAQRTVQPSETLYSTNECDGLGVYTPISRARWTADTTLAMLKTWTDAQVAGRDTLIAATANYAGWDYIMLGEMFCSAAVDLGPELSSAQLFALAEDRFTQALTAAQAAGNTRLATIAYAGRARAELDAGNKTAAATDAAKVPSGFVFYATADTKTSVRTNRVYAQQNGRSVTVAPPYRHLYVVNGTDSVPDTRVVVDSTGLKGGDGSSLIFTARKDSTGSTPMVVFDYAQAQLIIAEAQGGQTAVDIINNLRQAAGINVPFSSTDEATIQAQVLDERARQLFLEGTRFYDIRRANLPQIPAPGAAYYQGGQYGNERCLPIPDVETLNNPSFRSSTTGG